jgi:hypothetical protein
VEQLFSAKNILSVAGVFEVWRLGLGEPETEMPHNGWRMN